MKGDLELINYLGEESQKLREREKIFGSKVSDIYDIAKADFDMIMIENNNKNSEVYEKIKSEIRSYAEKTV